jgi:hypothetical protein
LSRVSTWARSSARRSIPSAIARSRSARSAGEVAAHAGKAAAAARTAASTSAGPPAATSASGCSPTGDTSVNVPAAPQTRWPPIQCRVSTATPATFATLTAVSVLIGPPRFNA